jgi:Domain of unknown function (DUF4430)
VTVRLGERRQAVLFAAILITAIAGLYAATQLLEPASVGAYVVHLANLEVEGSGWSVHYVAIATMNNTAFGLLREASARLGFSLAYVPYEIPKGVFVTGINGSVNGEGGRFWQYWVNGQYANLAADHMPLHDRDVVQWKFSGSQEGG